MEEAPFNLNKFEGSGTNENYADTYCVYIKNKKVQKTGFYTEEEARKLGVVGWVKNTSQGTVTGQVQGPEDKVNAMCRCSCSVDAASCVLQLKPL
ncbi:acylphosphatase-2 isoform X3 [Cygnus olor]|uniref:acylphosphatase-2 isoform X3 n=1 Tax=Cygnus olor TaxID=8869 RepID=UPI001ADDEBE3|nr:acylphosphatase-2 isoform X3 [Cygnus olor]